MTPQELIRFVSDGFDTAKAGRAAEIYDVVSQYYDHGLLDRRSHYAFGWIIYYALHQAENYDIDRRKRMLARYLNLEVARPHKLHSMILTEAIRLHKNASEAAYLAKKSLGSPAASNKTSGFSIIRFANLWNLGHLREGDWRRKEKDGKPLNSTVEKLITCYVNELESSRTTPGPEFAAIMRQAQQAYPDSSALMAQIAIIQEISGEKEEAITSLRNAILLSPSKFYLWSRLADLVGKEDDIKLYISLLYKALSQPGQEEFKGRIRISLAEAWIDLKAYAQALFEIQAVKSLYQRNSWHLPSRLTELEKAIPASTVAADPAPAYKRIASLADDYIYASFPETEAANSYHKESEMKTDKFGRQRVQPVAWRATDKNGHNYWFTPSRFNIDEALPVGTPLLLKIHGGKVVDAKIKK